MKYQLVYDLPIRIFHWLFAGLFVAAFLIAKTVEGESVIFSYHMLAGLLLSALVVFRIVWGFVGTRHSRFSSFALRPQDLLEYFRGFIFGGSRRWAGHNPASSWAAVTMLVLATGLGVTGFLMANGHKEELEDFHEVLANSFLILVLMHVAGVILHAFRHRDGMALAMVKGSKKEIPQSEEISNLRIGWALAFIGLVVMLTFYLAKNFDDQARTLDLFGTVLQLGES